MNKNTLMVLVLVVVIIGGYFLLNGPAAQAPEDNVGTSNPLEVVNPAAQVPTPSATPSISVIIYTDAGYSPKTLTVKVGDTVTWKNNSTHGMWTATAVHPDHTVYSGTSVSEHCPDASGTAFDACKNIGVGESWSFTFMKKGSWNYHNHSRASDWGTVIVQ